MTIDVTCLTVRSLANSGQPAHRPVAPNMAAAFQHVCNSLAITEPPVCAIMGTGSQYESSVWQVKVRLFGSGRRHAFGFTVQMVVLKHNACSLGPFNSATLEAFVACLALTSSYVTHADTRFWRAQALKLGLEGCRENTKSLLSVREIIIDWAQEDAVKLLLRHYRTWKW